MSCPDCVSGEFLPGQPTGVLSTQGAYLAAGTTQPSKRAIVLLTDIFGLPLKNCKIIADHFAKELGCDVWIPDYFAGRPIMSLNKMKAIERVAEPSLSVWDWFVKAIEEEKKYEKIGCVGYCYGGSAALRLGSKDFFKSIAIFHPGPFTVEDARSIKAATFWGCAAVDRAVSTKLLNETEALYAARKGTDTFVDYEIKIYEGTLHGFAIRPDLTNPAVKEAYEAALENTVSWFNKTLVV
ncbi:hypothetical protein H0H87_009405 [Tephrocybe sp. NHM501043]|nr:hypothetical protein H0H87_009405 [Tephrocybe sp. NHM501043]